MLLWHARLSQRVGPNFASPKFTAWTAFQVFFYRKTRLKPEQFAYRFARIALEPELPLRDRERSKCGGVGSIRAQRTACKLNCALVLSCGKGRRCCQRVVEIAVRIQRGKPQRAL